MDKITQYALDQISLVIKNNERVEKKLELLDPALFLASLNQIRNSRLQRVMRRLLGIPLEKIPVSLRTFLTDLLKKARNPKKELPVPSEISFKYGDFLIKECHAGILYPENKKYYIGVTHDVDNRIGYRYVPEMINVLKKNRIKSTINFLTHSSYKLEKSLVEDIRKEGFEVGLHGDIHDMGLAFRGRRAIRRRLERSLDYLGFQPFGFRSPSLSLSYDLLGALDDLHFTYDSTFQTGSSLYRSTEYPYIYKLDQYNLFEAPLFIQDDYFFRESRLSEKESLKIFTDLIGQMKKYSGAAIINLHPHIVRFRKYFFSGVLEFVSGEKDAFSGPLYTLIRFYQERRKAREAV
ncbi:MAG: polysaccharide deacetylase family protein [bacterium]|nr:polysaccharide deacetylase family protein [bacterium]